MKFFECIIGVSDGGVGAGVVLELELPDMIQKGFFPIKKTKFN